jgi:hypothetical protein
MDLDKNANTNVNYSSKVRDNLLRVLIGNKKLWGLSADNLKNILGFKISKGDYTGLDSPQGHILIHSGQGKAMGVLGPRSKFCDYIKIICEKLVSLGIYYEIMPNVVTDCKLTHSATPPLPHDDATATPPPPLINNNDNDNDNDSMVEMGPIDKTGGKSTRRRKAYKTTRRNNKYKNKNRYRRKRHTKRNKKSHRRRSRR